jgi:predicted TIM-barrel fold metal-dependent hydrolase
MSAVDTVQAEVRELVRRRGLDPFEDRAAVRRLVDEVISDYDDRVLTSALAPLADPRTAARRLRRRGRLRSAAASPARRHGRGDLDQQG